MTKVQPGGGQRRRHHGNYEAMISEGRFTQPPDYVVVARIVMTTKGALELAEAIKSTVAKHQAMTGRLHSSSGHA